MLASADNTLPCGPLRQNVEHLCRPRRQPLQARLEDSSRLAANARKVVFTGRRSALVYLSTHDPRFESSTGWAPSSSRVT